MKKIIFLDFDGVMDTAYYDHLLGSQNLPQCDPWGPIFDPSCVKNLERIINETNADIVVSSSWKDSMSYEQMLQMWKDRNLPGFVTDMTPTCSKYRGDEIKRWLYECHRECRYVIIDDLPAFQFHDDQMPYFLIANPYFGLEDHIADRAINILNG